jgi:RNA polymerase sigma factor (sigma-70 family)
MMNTWIDCSGCQRYIRARETTCPFCGGAVTNASLHESNPVPSGRRSRAASFAARTALVASAASLAACGGTGAGERVARDHRRRARRKPSHALPDPELLVDAHGFGPERGAAQSEELRRLMSLLDGIDDAKREAFVLSELEGLSAPEIARILEANVNTIYARIRAARRELESGSVLAAVALAVAGGAWLLAPGSGAGSRLQAPG